MKSSYFLIFLSIVILLYSLAHYYLYIRGMQAFSPNPIVKKWSTIGFITIASMFILGMFLERGLSSVYSEWILRIGTAWLAFLLYFLLAIFIIDVVRVFDYFIDFLPEFSQKSKGILGISVFLVVSITVLIGHINAKNIRITRVPLTINKQITGNTNVRILMASDLHFGAIIGEAWERKFLEIVRKEQPDLILLCGDLVDGEIAPVLRKQLGNHIQEIKTPLGLYAITGNHEYIGGIDKALKYLESINITVLRDQVITLPNGIQIVGRNDVSAKNFKNDTHNKSLDSLLIGIDRTKPIIVMNHQPFNLEEASNAQVDMHLSGHTHHGQLWPFNYITQALFELSWGYLQKGNTHFYVSAGYGTWGPTVRLGNHPEVVVFDVQFMLKR